MGDSQFSTTDFYCPGYSLVEDSSAPNGERIMPVNREEDRVPVVITKLIWEEKLQTRLECPYISLAWWDMTPEDRLKGIDCAALNNMPEGLRKGLKGHELTRCPYLFSEDNLTL